jgi:hypothetical protein
MFFGIAGVAVAVFLFILFKPKKQVPAIGIRLLKL